MSISEIHKFDSDEFINNIIGKNSCVFRGGVEDWPAVKKWNLDYFAQTCPNIPVVTKVFNDSGIDIKQMSMKGYVDAIFEFKKIHGEETDKVAPYCHDVPIFLLEKSLINDIGAFPKEVLPEWYAKDWSRYAQFFMSAKNSVTPLHFDTLLTHNIFFQIKGRKIFTIIRPEEGKYCYRKNWRWFDVNPENPNYIKHPDFENVSMFNIEVRAGDIFYMPPGTLHQVRSIDDCISFNVDFHTLKSASKSFLGYFKGMPKENLYYNFQSLRALVFKQNNDVLFERYKPYLNYIS